MSRYIVRVNPRSSRLDDEKEKDYGVRSKPKKRSPQRGFDKNFNVLLRANRACEVSPNRHSKDRVIFASNLKTFGSRQPKTDERYKNLLLEQYGFEPDGEVPSHPPPKVRTNGSKLISQKVSSTRPKDTTQPSHFAMSDISTWHHVETTDDVELYLDNKIKNESLSFNKENGRINERDPSFLIERSSSNREFSSKLESVQKQQTYKDSSNTTEVDWKFEENHPLCKFVERKSQKKEVPVQSEPEFIKFSHYKTEYEPTSIIITEIPTIKLIAEKFVRFKKDFVELRKLSEKIVCVEYDIYDQEDYNAGNAQPIDKMRAFFSIKPPKYSFNEKGFEENVTPLAEIPSVIKNKYNIADEDLRKITEKEIEIIDETIQENKAYLDDLKKILNRRPDSRNKSASLDLQYLYEMAKREHLPTDYDFCKLLTKSELDELKDLILKRCVSSQHGISRRVVRCDEATEKAPDIVSKNTLAEIIKTIP